MALHLDFSPKNMDFSQTQSIKEYCSGFQSDTAIELATIICDRMNERGLSPNDLLNLYKQHREKKGLTLREPDSSLLAKFVDMVNKGFVPKKLRFFIFNLLQINENEINEATNQQDLRDKMAAALLHDYEADLFMQNLSLILNHSDFILKYHEFASIQLRNVGYSYSWLGGRYICLGELLHYYRLGLGIAYKGCPHCADDVHNYWCCGSVLSGVRKIYGVCRNCGQKVENANDYRNASTTSKPRHEILLKDPRCFGAMQTRQKYELPARHVPNKFIDKNPWNMFSLVQLLKTL